VPHGDDFFFQPHPHTLEWRRVGEAFLGLHIGKARVGPQVGDKSIYRLAGAGQKHVDALGREQDGAFEAQFHAMCAEFGLERFALIQGDKFVAGDVNDRHGKTLSARRHYTKRFCLAVGF